MTKESRIAALLRKYGVGNTISIRAAATKIGISRETLSRLMRPLDSGETRRIHKGNLDKIADGLGIPRDLLEREMLADWGWAQAVTGSDVAEVLSQIQGMTQVELAQLVTEIGRLQQSQIERAAHPHREESA